MCVRPGAYSMSNCRPMFGLLDPRGTSVRPVSDHRKIGMGIETGTVVDLHCEEEV